MVEPDYPDSVPRKAELFQEGKASVVKCPLNSRHFPGEDGLGGREHIYNLFHSKEVIQSSKGPRTSHPRLLSGHTLTGYYDGLITIHNRVGGEWRGRNLDPTCLLFDRTENRIQRRKVREGRRTCCLFSYAGKIFAQIKQKILRSTD